MIKIYNTLSRKKEDFIPLSPQKIKIYTCGPTIYDRAHIGNFRTFVFEDIVVRYLRAKGYQLQWVMNYTDIDDKIIRKTKEKVREEKDSQQRKATLNDLRKLTTKYKTLFEQDFAKIKIKRPNHMPEATFFIDEMVKMVQELEKKGYAYRSSDGSYFFNIKKYSGYGELSHLSLDSLKQNASGRTEQDEYNKSNIGDFVLWKARKAEDEDIFFSTALGEGRPGWHLECSVMSEYYLGTEFDLHMGGIDNLFPHHENERAQSCSAHEKGFAKYWMHTAHLNVSTEKMSKSEGNQIYLEDLFNKGFEAETIRLTFCSSHYRKSLTLSDQLLRENQAKHTRIKGFLLDVLSFLLKEMPWFELKSDSDISSLKEKLIGKGLSLPFKESRIQETYNKIHEAMEDDFNIPKAIGHIFDFISEFWPLFSRKKNESVDLSLAKDDLSLAKEIVDFFIYLEEIFGFFSFSEILSHFFLKFTIQIGDEQGISNLIIEDFVNSFEDKEALNRENTLIALHTSLNEYRFFECKLKGNFELSDNIREYLKEKGLGIRDSKDTTELYLLKED